MPPQSRLERAIGNALTLAAVSVALGAWAATAHATFPGSNGPIAFRQFDPALDEAPLFTAMPTGTQITELSGRPGFSTDWRADGERIAFDFFQADGDEQIATVNPDGSDLDVITSGRGIHEIPSWSPDGQRIVFNYSPDRPDEHGFETRLWTMRADGSHARHLPMRRDGFDVEPRYSPDGQWVAFNRLRFGPFQLAAFVVSTEKPYRVRRITPWNATAEHPTWSPDGEWITYNRAPDGTIQVVRPNGDDRHSLLRATSGFGAHKPWFSPEGSQILFMCENQGTLNQPPNDYNEDICVMDADGSDVETVVDTPDTFENWPSWGPASAP